MQSMIKLNLPILQYIPVTVIIKIVKLRVVLNEIVKDNDVTFMVDRLPNVYYFDMQVVPQRVLGTAL